MTKNQTIPNGETLFRFVNPDSLPEDQEDLPIGIFNDNELSCDWKKLRPDPGTSFHISEGKTLVIAIEICDEIKNPENPKRLGEKVEAWKQDVIHDPISNEEDPIHGENEAHSLIRGRKKKAVVDAIRDHSTVYNLYS